jgi:hypothetical protein
LKLQWHVSNFIEEQSAAIRQREAAEMRIDSTRKGSTFVSEELAFEKPGTICLACHWTQNWNLEPELAADFKTLTKADCIDSNARHCSDASVSFGCDAHRVNELVVRL